MSTRYPDKWVVIKTPLENDYLYKVFATWSGGYLSADSWMLNSGIKNVTEDRDLLVFHGRSGSQYICGKQSYGTNMYSQGILNMMIGDLRDNLGVEIEVLSKEKALQYAKSFL